MQHSYTIVNAGEQIYDIEYIKLDTLFVIVTDL